MALSKKKVSSFRHSQGKTSNLTLTNYINRCDWRDEDTSIVISALQNPQIRLLFVTTSYSSAAKEWASLTWLLG